jgi:hypothetical protein
VKIRIVESCVVEGEETGKVYRKLKVDVALEGEKLLEPQGMLETRKERIRGALQEGMRVKDEYPCSTISLYSVRLAVNIRALLLCQTHKNPPEPRLCIGRLRYRTLKVLLSIDTLSRRLAAIWVLLNHGLIRSRTVRKYDERPGVRRLHAFSSVLSATRIKSPASVSPRADA